jgi:hypothetical protein
MAAAAMATGARLFETPNMEGETMTIFACGFGSGLDQLVARALITLITVIGSALALVVVAVAAIMRRLKSVDSE